MPALHAEVYLQSFVTENVHAVVKFRRLFLCAYVPKQVLFLCNFQELDGIRLNKRFYNFVTEEQSSLYWQKSFISFNL